MIRSLLLLLSAVAIALLNYFYGSTISVFISVSIVVCLLYYGLYLAFEDVVNHKADSLNNPSEAVYETLKAGIKTKRLRLTFFAFTIVFIASIITLKRATNPGGNSPWFLNNEYHAIANKGIAFDKSLTLTVPTYDSGQVGSITFSANGEEGGIIKCNNFFEPVMLQYGGHFTPINPIFPQTITDNFEIKNEHNSILFQKKEQQQGFLQKLLKGKQYVWELSIYSADNQLAEEENMKLPFTAKASVPYKALKEGMALYQLLLNTKAFESNNAEAYKVLEHILRQVGNTLLLANNEQPEAAERYNLFPDKVFLSNGYKLAVEGKQINPVLTNTFKLPKPVVFYIGFTNKQALCTLARFQKADYHYKGAGTGNALMFHHPPMYRLTGPAEEQQVGSKNMRFITNSQAVIVESAQNEGFYFNNFDLRSDALIHAHVEYLSQRPNTALSLTLHDRRASTQAHRVVEDGKFYVSSTNPGVQYLFDVRDFSDNGFSYNQLLFFAALLYVLMLAFLLLVPGKNLGRVETPIFIVLYTLLILRFLLYWRLATFPPLEGISKYELENTLLGFDYKWFIHWPIPLTLIWTCLMLILLAFYRKGAFKGLPAIIERTEGKLYGLVERSYDKLSRALRFLKLPAWQEKLPQHRVAIAYGVALSLLLLVFFINKLTIRQDAITRIIAILLPLLAYCIAATRANKVFEVAPLTQGSKVLPMGKAWIHYWVSNPTFAITLTTIAYFALTDRGFAILFTLFILLKNIFLNFLKKTFQSDRTTLWQMMLQPKNYWVYGLAALAVYLFVLWFKSLFYYLITYKLLVLWLFLLLPVLVYWAYYRSHVWWRNVLTGFWLLYSIALLLPASHKALEEKATSAIRHVQYRASIIHQPISKMLEQNPYSSFQTQKIIETAENQWFINSYIQHGYRRGEVFNLRAFSKVGVNYNTQTRDVVIARFVIGEWGNYTMYLILLLCMLPLVLYLLSFKITDTALEHRLLPSTYAGLIPLLLFFTFCLFVWLTSTNRFVFFGQDYPFLSLTSRLSVVMPLALFVLVLAQKPVMPESRKMRLPMFTLRYGLLFVIIGVFALTTFRSNELSKEFFSVVVEKTKRHINKDLNGFLSNLQDSLVASHKRVGYAGIIHLLEKDKGFRALLKDSALDPYTKSILEQFVAQPYRGFTVNNPLYIQYDNGRYEALYNEHLYMRLPLVESRKIWNGAITESMGADTYRLVRLHFNNTSTLVPLPYFRSDIRSQVQVGIIPASWIVGGKEPVAIVNVTNALRQQAKVHVYKNNERNMLQSARGYASTCAHKDVAMVHTGGKQFNISINSTGNEFATNKWVNGNYRVAYPQRQNNFWVMHLAEALRSSFRGDSLIHRQVPITLDYDLHQQVQQLITQQYAQAQRRNNRFKFTAIAADGDGNVRLMAAHVSNRKEIDPNDRSAIEHLRKQHFFFSNTRNERDQWGNANLLAMQMGPGSSIKPLVASLNASQVNAGWQQLYMQAAALAEYNTYAGYKMIKPWRNVDHVNSGLIGMPLYIEASSNYYQSLMMFLGAYPYAAFVKNGKASLAHVLSKSAGAQNNFPLLQYAGSTYFLPHYTQRKKQWPLTDAEEQKQITFFGNENSILANAFEVNANLRTKDKDKNDYTPGTYERSNMMDSATYALLMRQKGGSFIWTFPEQSTFLQSLRAYTEKSQNFNLGLKTTALGGYPYQISPAKMLEMYMSMFLQNRDFRLRLTPAHNTFTPWHVDSSWGNTQAYNSFLAENIFKGMNDVIYGAHGTAKALSDLRAAHPGLFFYAKTGTINEEGSGGRDSRRLIVCVSNKDMQAPQNIAAKDGKLYAFYFTIDNNRDFDWALLKTIIRESLASASCKKYFEL